MSKLVIYELVEFMDFLKMAFLDRHEHGSWTAEDEKKYVAIVSILEEGL